MERTFTPALGYSRLTPLYDIAIRLLTKERVWRDFLVQQVNPQPTDRIVDIGCGTGSLAIRLKNTEPGAEIIGLDPDSDVLARARQKALEQEIDIRWTHGFLDEEILEKIGPVSKVVSSLVFHQTPLPEKSAILSAMYTLLDPGGSLHIADYGLQRTKLMRLLFRLSVQTIDGIHDTQPNADGVLPHLIEEAGFIDVQETRVIKTATGSISMYAGRKGLSVWSP